MVHITNGNLNLEVTKGAFESFYANLGFNIVKSFKKTPVLTDTLNQEDNLSDEEEDSTQQEEDEEEEEEEEIDLSEIPLSEMGFDQLTAYADELGLNHDGVRSKKELRYIIRQHLNS